MILVDTSVWVDHLRAGVRALADYLDRGHVLCHPFVVGELALGHLSDREDILTLMDHLPPVAVATADEVRELIDMKNLMGSGIGYVDAHLVASALLAGVPIWTFDRKLRRVTGELGVAASI